MKGLCHCDHQQELAVSHPGVHLRLAGGCRHQQSNWCEVQEETGSEPGKVVRLIRTVGYGAASVSDYGVAGLWVSPPASVKLGPGGELFTGR
ncbi:hypothetical protein NDU88_011558 [Pleurodeles waltl]|uniref:Uncharacterized protein n=1 Tax=Pleurodeles waltl TaxID=8319 RepID=A0AAV7R0C0_PLEWA|nr:hypothetical protein NDU88_011558 [Pleurodeles waltl]